MRTQGMHGICLDSFTSWKNRVLVAIEKLWDSIFKSITRIVYHVEHHNQYVKLFFLVCITWKSIKPFMCSRSKIELKYNKTLDISCYVFFVIQLDKKMFDMMNFKIDLYYELLSIAISNNTYISCILLIQLSYLKKFEKENT